MSENGLLRTAEGSISKMKSLVPKAHCLIAALVKLQQNKLCEEEEEMKVNGPISKMIDNITLVVITVLFLGDQLPKNRRISAGLCFSFHFSSQETTPIHPLKWKDKNTCLTNSWRNLCGRPACS